MVALNMLENESNKFFFLIGIQLSILVITDYFHFDPKKKTVFTDYRYYSMEAQMRKSLGKFKNISEDYESD